MKKFFNSLLKGRKDESEEEVKQGEEDIHEHDSASTKDKDSNSNEDSREAKLEEIKRSMLDKKVKKFESVLNERVVDLEKLKALAWNGIPQTNAKFRTESWRLLLDYQPNDQDMAKETLGRKREEYTDMIEHYFGLIGFESVE